VGRLAWLQPYRRLTEGGKIALLNAIAQVGQMFVC
jgi:hypothetical protein